MNKCIIYLCVDICSKQIIRICRQSQLHPLKSKKDIAMEMPVDRDDFNFEVFETDDQNPIPKSKRLCPQCNGAVFGRRNKIFCSSNCRKRHSEPTRNSYSSPTKRRENSEFFDRALRLAVELYALPPNQRLGFMKDLMDYARLGEDPQLRDPGAAPVQFQSAFRASCPQRRRSCIERQRVFVSTISCRV